MSASCVICTAYPEGECESGSVRLLNRNFPGSGIVEICLRNTWGTLCSEVFEWSPAEAAVTCRQLGFIPEGEVYSFLHTTIAKLKDSSIAVVNGCIPMLYSVWCIPSFYIITGFAIVAHVPQIQDGLIHQDIVNCNGNESSLLDCEILSTEGEEFGRDKRIAECTHSFDIGVICSGM